MYRIRTAGPQRDSVAARHPPRALVPGRFGVSVGEVSGAVHLGPLPRAVVVTQLVAPLRWADAVPAVVVDLNHRRSRSAISSIASPVPRWTGPGALCARLGVYRFRHFAAAADVLCFTGHSPCRKPGAPPDGARRLVFSDRRTPYTALSTGCIARPAHLIAFGVTARFTPWTGCIARRTERGTDKRLDKPMNDCSAAATRTLQTSSSGLLSRSNEGTGSTCEDRPLNGRIASVDVRRRTRTCGPMVTQWDTPLLPATPPENSLPPHSFTDDSAVALPLAQDHGTTDAPRAIRSGSTCWTAMRTTASSEVTWSCSPPSRHRHPSRRPCHQISVPNLRWQGEFERIGILGCTGCVPAAVPQHVFAGQTSVTR